MRHLVLFFLLGAAAVQAAEVHVATPLEILMQRARLQFHSPHSAHHHGPGSQGDYGYDPGNPDGPGEGFDPANAKTFTVNAFRFDYTVSPTPFAVNKGDSVRINLVAQDDGAGGGHGFFLEIFSEGNNFVAPGTGRTIEFVAKQAGTFRFFCTNVCGIGHTTMDGIFTVNDGPAPIVDPAVTSVAPSSGSTAGGTTITIRGDRFASGATVKIGDSSATDVTFVDATTLTARTPMGPWNIAANSARDIVVRNADGKTATLANAFTWTIPSPAIGTIAPNSAATSGGSVVTIRGAGFTSALPISVSFGGVPATSIAVVDAVTLTAVVPPRAVGTVDVTVAVGGSSATAAGAFTYRPPAPKRRAIR